MTVHGTLARRQASEQRRRIRYGARDAMRAFTTLKRTKACGSTPCAGGVSVVKSGSSAGFAGLTTCGSTWGCPVCSAKIAEHRRQDLHALMLSHRARGGGFGLLTLTMRHRKGQRLADLWDDLSLAWRKVQQHRAWRREVKPNLTGWVRVVEVTHGARGWHVHLHAVLFTETPWADEAFARVEGTIVERWADALADLGRTCVPEAQQFRRLTGNPADTLADYFSKATLEVTRSDLKDARFGSRTPFAILRGLVGLGDVEDPDEDAALWAEWEAASKGRRQFGYSRGLREALAVEAEISDEAAAEECPGGEVVVTWGNDDWRAVRPHAVRLVECAELGATVEAARGLVLAYCRDKGLPLGHWVEGHSA